MALLLLLLLEVVQAAPDIMQGVDIVALAKAQRPGCLVWGGSQSEPGTNQMKVRISVSGVSRIFPS
jgi:hypothetical protein